MKKEREKKVMTDAELLRMFGSYHRENDTDPEFAESLELRLRGIDALRNHDAASRRSKRIPLLASFAAGSLLGALLMGVLAYNPGIVEGLASVFSLSVPTASAVFRAICLSVSCVLSLLIALAVNLICSTEP